MHINLKGLVVISLLSMSSVFAAPKPPTELKIDSKVALASVMALSDQHIESVEVSLRLLAQTGDAQSGEWEKIRGTLATAASANVEALYWFALPDGTYWSVQKGKEPGNLKDRAYFPKLLQGKTVRGDLVVSKSTGKSVAIVAVPVLQKEKVIGVLGASIYLDKLSALIEKQMALESTMIFYSFDSQPLVGLNWDPAVIFADPMKLGSEVSTAFKEMLTKDEGSVEYTFRGKKRTVLFKKSARMGWWYAFGLIPEGREKPDSHVSG